MRSRHSSAKRVFVSIVAGCRGAVRTGALCHVRLQPARRRDEARQGRGQAGHDAILEYNHARLFRAGRTRVAVCLLPGTEVAFENKVERHLTGFHLLFRRTKPLPHQVARFRQVNMDNPCTHHDALEFPDGQIVLVTHLREGQRATVLQLPAQPKNADAAPHPALPEARCALDRRLHDPQAG